jgi:hypothetical protein
LKERPSGINTMKARLYFQLSFLLPIILPLLAWLTAGFNSNLGNGISTVLILSLVVGGIPYLLFLAGFFCWVPGNDLRSIQRFTFLAPLLFIPVFLACGFVVMLPKMRLGEELRNMIDWVLGFSYLILIVGYFYVILVNAGYYLLRFAGFFEGEIRSEHAQAH